MLHRTLRCRNCSRSESEGVSQLRERCGPFAQFPYMRLEHFEATLRDFVSEAFVWRRWVPQDLRKMEPSMILQFRLRILL